MDASNSFGRTVADFNILVAEDEVINQRIVTRILSNAGYGSMVVADGRDVIRALESSKYDLILMDYFLPGMDGVEVTRAIRRGQSGLVDPDIPIIALTAHDSEEHLEKCTAAGMNACLTKPAEPQVLITAIKRLLDEDRAEDSPAVCRNGESIKPGAPERLARNATIESSDDAVIDKFLQELPMDVSRLHSALEAGDRSKIELVSHRLRGALAYLGASGLAALLAELERAARTGDLELARSLVSELDGELKKLQAGSSVGEIE